MLKKCDYTGCDETPTVTVAFEAPQSNGLRGHYCEDHAGVALSAFPMRAVDKEEVRA